MMMMMMAAAVVMVNVDDAVARYGDRRGDEDGDHWGVHATAGAPLRALIIS